MNVDLVPLLIVPVLVAFYIYLVVSRKKREKEEAAKVESIPEPSAFAKRVKALRELSPKEFKNVTESHLTNYGDYRLSIKQYLFYSILAGTVLYFIGYLFYENVILAGIIAIGGLFYPKIQRKILLSKRKEKLSLQFKEAIASLSSSLAAGRSIENSFREVVNDLKLLYPDPNTYIIKEFEIINRRVENGETIERAIEDFAIRSDIEDVINFADVFLTCKRTGGNLVEVIRRTSDVISEKIEIQQEVQVMIAQKKFESRILAVAPIGMIVLLKYSAADYLEPMYVWPGTGPLVMTVCLAILVFSFWLSQKIMNVKV